MLVGVSLSLIRVLHVANFPQEPVVSDVPQEPAFTLGLIEVDKFVLDERLAYPFLRASKGHDSDPEEGMELGWVAFHEPSTEPGLLHVINYN